MTWSQLNLAAVWRVREAMRRVVTPAELVRYGMYIAHIGAGEGHSGIRGGQRHLFARR